MTDLPKMNVESFNLDHTKVVAPYIRVADRKVLPHGDVLTKFDVRFCQPNVEHLEMPAVHSIEHSFAECVREISDDVIDFSPMGCQTGFYLIMSGEHTPQQAKELVLATMARMLTLDAVPAANEVQCGWGAHHSLDDMKDEVHAFLENSDVLLDVMR
ncbi:S-ribosylhomocysteine lyase [Demequina capsici]|uniref:S-ribosylhomocysteine lyase n=1 Tax=Demequina capsici TaxID=3075620 RepID=A0AA96FEB2_9MICO|nr:S-ribosylhomocysteine lyase [Demequina sp. PMTSA13]WNM27949.1 S-ribosylhomocysteine lyase [Demequina sp. PMTSA13]